MGMGENIKALRLEKGWTQEELGKRVGVQKSAIAKYEKGVVTNMKRSVIQEMSELFGVSPSYLMGLPESGDTDAPAAAASAAISNQTIEKFSPLLEQLSSDDLDKVYELANLLLLSEKYRGINGRSPDK